MEQPEMKTILRHCLETKGKQNWHANTPDTPFFTKRRPKDTHTNYSMNQAHKKSIHITKGTCHRPPTRHRTNHPDRNNHNNI